MQDGLSDPRRKMSRCADARALGLEELEEFIAEVSNFASAPTSPGGLLGVAEAKA